MFKLIFSARMSLFGLRFCGVDVNLGVFVYVYCPDFELL